MRVHEMNKRIEKIENRAGPYEEPRVLYDAPPEQVAEARKWAAEKPGRLFLEIRYV